MSVLSIIFALFLFILSPIGFAFLGAGLVAFFALPIASAVTNFKKPSHLMFFLATSSISRAAFLTSEANDILFKKMTYDGIGVEKITVDGEEKVFEDPDGALHRWMGITFALANEQHGVLFDPRHAALGQRKHDLRQRDEDQCLATSDEWDREGVSKWMPGVFEMPSAHELVDLSKVAELVDGGERSEYAKRVEEIYKHSREPFEDGSGISKFFYPIGALLASFLGIWFFASKIGTGDAGGGSTVGWGVSMLFIMSIGGSNPDIDWHELLRVGVGVMVFLGFPMLGFAFIFIAISPVVAVGGLFAFTLGFLLVPFLSTICKVSSRLSAVWSKLYFKLGFMAYQRPVFEWTPEAYRLREYRDLDDNGNIEWYGVFGRDVGFTYTPGEGAWGPEYMETGELEDRQPVADGGTTNSDIPPGYVKADTMGRDDYGAYIPSRLKGSKYYLHSGIATGRFKNSATGEKALRRLLEAKEKHGGANSGMDDKTLLYLTTICGVLGSALGVILFVL